MKKIISILTAVTVLFSLCSFSSNAFAEEPTEVYLGSNHFEYGIERYETTYDKYGNPIENGYYPEQKTYVFEAPREGIYTFSCGIKDGTYDMLRCYDKYDDEHVYFHIKKGDSVTLPGNIGCCYDEEDFDDDDGDRDVLDMIEEDYWEIYDDWEYRFYMDYLYSPTRTYGDKSFDVYIREIKDNIHYGCYEIDVNNREVYVTSIPKKEIEGNILGYPVTTIKEFACSDKQLKKITIPASIEYIEDFAFTDCYKLEKVVFENENTVYGEKAFYNCGDDLEIIGGKEGTRPNKKPTVSKEKITSKKAFKRGFKVNWKKLGGVKGYQVQYSLNKSFKNAVKKNVKSDKTSLTVNGLKKNRKYYVRVRAYKVYKGEKVYGKWSNKVSVKTK